VEAEEAKGPGCKRSIRSKKGFALDSQKNNNESEGRNEEGQGSMQTVY
jgi:hypothetical protein